ncbi:hypothetical protein [Saccharicrinis carchari]|uniref:hypothetical protein n=1 Tax=Saccharicrinis carchari TaxID=1168039 RepID=UPI001156ECB4|nr:hypothetical protein [Saccharicrinis carchari]
MSYDNKKLKTTTEELKAALKNRTKLSYVSDNAPVGNREIEIELKEKALRLSVTYHKVILQVYYTYFSSEAQYLQHAR